MAETTKTVAAPAEAASSGKDGGNKHRAKDAPIRLKIGEGIPKDAVSVGDFVEVRLVDNSYIRGNLIDAGPRQLKVMDMDRKEQCIEIAMVYSIRKTTLDDAVLLARIEKSEKEAREDAARVQELIDKVHRL